MDSARRSRLPRPISHYYEDLSHSSQYFSEAPTYGYENRSILRNFTDDVDPFSIIEMYVQTVVENAIDDTRKDGHNPYFICVAFSVGGGKEFLVSWNAEDESRRGRLTEEFANSYKKGRRFSLNGKPLVIQTTIVTDPRFTL